MNSNNKILKTLRKDDIVVIETSLDISYGEAARYLIRKVDKKSRSLSVLSLEPFFFGKEQVEAPVLMMPFSMIKKIKHGNKNDLLFLFDQIKNPHIMEAIRGLK
jgi:hypothetical protein